MLGFIRLALFIYKVLYDYTTNQGRMPSLKMKLKTDNATHPFLFLNCQDIKSKGFCGKTIYVINYRKISYQISDVIYNRAIVIRRNFNISK